MKFNQIILLFVLLTTFAACSEGIRGSGDVITEVRSLENFDTILVEDALNVEITQGDFSVEVRADDNIVPKIETTVNSGRLTIGFESGLNIRGTTTTEIYVTMPAISQLEMKDAVDVELMGFTGLSDLEVTVEDASDLELSGSADILNITVEDASDVRGFDFITNTCNVALSDASELDIFCNDVINGTLEDASILRYKGNAEIRATTSDASDIRDAN